MTPEFKSKMDQIINDNRIVLYMKGDRHRPQCGFSARVVGMLEELEVDYHTIDIFSDPEIRSGMKEYSAWPTFPQFYFKNEFIGGCDIITGMFQSGELHKLLGLEQVEVAPPEIHLTDAAVGAFKSATQRYPGEIRIEITAQFQYDIGVGPKQPGDIEVVANECLVLFSRSSAKRANGLRIDFKSDDGLIIDNPNEPKRVKQLDPREMKHWMDTKREFVLIDVRGDDERAIANIDGSQKFNPGHHAELPKDAILVFQCHHGMRSMRGGYFCSRWLDSM